MKYGLVKTFIQTRLVGFLFYDLWRWILFETVQGRLGYAWETMMVYYCTMNGWLISVRTKTRLCLQACQHHFHVLNIYPMQLFVVFFIWMNLQQFGRLYCTYLEFYDISLKRELSGKYHYLLYWICSIGLLHSAHTYYFAKFNLLVFFSFLDISRNKWCANIICVYINWLCRFESEGSFK